VCVCVCVCVCVHVCVCVNYPARMFSNRVNAEIWLLMGRIRTRPLDIGRALRAGTWNKNIVRGLNDNQMLCGAISFVFVAVASSSGV
jgi:hypothetical protein